MRSPVAARMLVTAALALSIASPMPSSAAGMTAQCYVLVLPGTTATCESTFKTPPSDDPTVHGAFHMDIPATGAVTIEWIGYSDRLLLSWECSIAGLVPPDRATAAGSPHCERTQHVPTIVPYGTQKIRVRARTLYCSGGSGLADACAAHGTLVFA